MPLHYREMAVEKKARPRKGPAVPIEMTGLPERLKRAMRNRGVDQPELAKNAGVSQGAISKLVNGGSLEGATAVVVARLALALRVPSGWLLTAEGDVIPRVGARLAGDGPVVEFDEARDPLVPPRPSPPELQLHESDEEPRRRTR
jgi:transcriptional regulator with XRE-family HTH domain